MHNRSAREIKMENLQSYATAISTALSWAKSIKDLLPEKEKPQAEQFINNLQLQEIALAQDLGYPTCRCTWPPTIMLKSKDELYEYYCPNCNQTGALGKLLEHQ